MVFPLTGSLFADILNALENQEQSFLIDAESRTLVHADGITSDGIRYYSLPEWDSAAGFALRTEFADKLRAPLAKEELQRVLHSGRGVFKSFKNVLKEFPQVEKLWHLYKNKSMQRFIGSWYNSLREIWGLEQLELEPEENGDLLHDDFIFSEYDESGFSEISKIFLHAEGNCSDGDFPEQINKAALKLWEQQFSCCGKNRRICRFYNGGSYFGKNRTDIHFDRILCFRKIQRTWHRGGTRFHAHSVLKRLKNRINFNRIYDSSRIRLEFIGKTRF